MDIAELITIGRLERLYGGRMNGAAIPSYRFMRGVGCSLDPEYNKVLLAYLRDNDDKPEPEKVGSKYAHLLQPAEAVRESLVVGYLEQSAKCISETTQARRCTVTLRTTDADLMTEIMEALLFQGYKCEKQSELVLFIKW